MQKTGLLVLVMVLILGVSIGEAHAQFSTTNSRTVTLYPGERYVNQMDLRQIDANEIIGIKVEEELGLSVRFWIMNSSEFGKMQSIGGYSPVTQLNITTSFYWNQSFIFPVAADYIYGVNFTGGMWAVVTIQITRDSGIDGFTMFWALSGLLALVLVIFIYQNRSKRNINVKTPNSLT